MLKAFPVNLNKIIAEYEITSGHAVNFMKAVKSQR